MENPSTETGKESVTLRLPGELIRDIRDMAAQERRTISAMVQCLLEKAIEDKAAANS